MKLTEKFDQHKLNYIIENIEKYENCIDKELYMSPAREDFLRSIGVLDECNQDMFYLPKKYLKLSKNGIINVSYQNAKGTKSGRLFSKNGVSLQGMSVEIRNTISGEFYNDIDMVNAHPTILLALCEKNDIDCNRLKYYVENREKCLKEIMSNNNISRYDAKQTFLSIMNGGNKAYKNLINKPMFLKKYKSQMEGILNDIMELYPGVYNDCKITKPNNPKGSAMNKIICRYENDILLFIHKELGAPENAVLCFDGIMVLKSIDLNDEVIDNLQNRIIEKFNIPIKLKIKPMTPVLDIEDDYPNYEEFLPFNPKDKFTWLDFVYKYHGVTFNSKTDLLEKTRTDVNRVYAWVESSSGFNIRKSDCNDNVYDITSGNTKISRLYFQYYDKNAAGVDVLKKINFNQYVELFLLNLNIYQTVDFDPSNTNPKVFNLWTGYKANYIEDVSVDNPPEGIKLILNHIKEVYCSDDENIYEYFLTLLHSMLRYPENALNVAVFLYSKQQGTGKNIILNFLMEYVIGNEMSYLTTGLDNVLSKFNSSMKNKKMIVVDEIASSSESWCSNFDKMKTLITADSLIIEKKGVDSFSIKNLGCYFFLSNNADAIRMEKTDRRYLALEVSQKYLNNFEYFNKLRETFTDENGDLFYSYILNRGKKMLLNNRSHIKIPLTNFKKSVLLQSSSSTLLFISHVREDIDIFKENNHLDQDNRITPMNLYKLYERWCGDCNERIIKYRKFILNLKGEINKIHTRAGTLYEF